MRRPQLLILDEPLDSLDLPNQAAVAALRAADLHDRGRRRCCSSPTTSTRCSATSTGSSTSPAAARSAGASSEVITGPHAERAVRRADRGAAHQRRAARRRRPARGARTITATGTSRELRARRLSLEPGRRPARSCSRSRSWSTRSRRRTIVAVLAAVVGWYMVLRRQSVRRPHAVGDGVPGRRRRGAGRAADRARLLPRLRRRGARDRRAARPRRAARLRRARRRRSGPSRRSGWPPASCSCRSTTPSSAAPRRCCSAPSSGSAAARCWCCWWSRWSRSALLALIGRPLLFATLDPEVARARGVPVAVARHRLPALLALAVAATSQITGALLVFALLVAPAGRAPS